MTVKFVGQGFRRLDESVKVYTAWSFCFGLKSIFHGVTNTIFVTLLNRFSKFNLFDSKDFEKLAYLNSLSMGMESDQKPLRATVTRFCATLRYPSKQFIEALQFSSGKWIIAKLVK